jgi:hypothetical protein
MKSFLHFVKWAIQNNLSVDQCFHFDTTNNIPQPILLNMIQHNTTQLYAYNYETHCHNCGLSIQIGQKYCCHQCFKLIEIFHYKCFWNTTCHICFIY